MSSALYAQKPTWFDSNGDPLVGGLVYIYEHGTSTPAALYADADLSVAAPNPIELDARGQPTNAVFLEDGQVYDVAVYDADDVLQESAQGITAPLTTGTTPFADTAETLAGATSTKAVTPAGGAAAYDRKATAAAHTAGKSTARVVLTPSAGSVTPNLALGNVFNVGTGTPPVLTGNVTINNPTGPLSGQAICFILKQDATGGRTITWGAKYKFATGSASLVTTANAINKVVFQYDIETDLYLGDIGPAYV
jgi:hypothetical protein